METLIVGGTITAGSSSRVKMAHSEAIFVSGSWSYLNAVFTTFAPRCAFRFSKLDVRLLELRWPPSVSLTLSKACV